LVSSISAHPPQGGRKWVFYSLYLFVYLHLTLGWEGEFLNIITHQSAAMGQDSNDKKRLTCTTEITVQWNVGIQGVQDCILSLQKDSLKSYPMKPVNVTLFGNRVFVNLIKMLN
jgi:hypothetical protein